MYWAEDALAAEGTELCDFSETMLQPVCENVSRCQDTVEVYVDKLDFVPALLFYRTTMTHHEVRHVSTCDFFDDAA